MSVLTQEVLRTLVRYDSDTGIFYWRVDRRSVRKGQIIGSVSQYGYLQACIMQKYYYLHRLAFLYMTGAFPVNQVDHINGIRDDNRWANLREATASQNGANRWTLQKNNKSGFRGVCFVTSAGKWQASAKIRGRLFYIGMFSDATTAAAAYEDFVRQFHGEFFNRHGLSNSPG